MLGIVGVLLAEGPDTTDPKLKKENTMFRKLILSAVVATGTLAALTLTPSAADARPPVYRYHGPVVHGYGSGYGSGYGYGYGNGWGTWGSHWYGSRYNHYRR
jgi:hypothetical protein